MKLAAATLCLLSIAATAQIMPSADELATLRSPATLNPRMSRVEQRVFTPRDRGVSYTPILDLGRRPMAPMNIEPPDIIWKVLATGANEIPPNGSLGSAEGQGSQNGNSSSTFMSVSYSGLSGAITGAEIRGPAGLGSTGPTFVVLNFTGTTAGTISGTVNSFPTWIGSGYYLEVYSTAFLAGEIRGQFEAVPPPVPEPEWSAGAGALALVGWIAWRRGAAIDGQHHQTG